MALLGAQARHARASSMVMRPSLRTRSRRCSAVALQILAGFQFDGEVLQRVVERGAVECSEVLRRQAGRQPRRSRAACLVRWRPRHMRRWRNRRGGARTRGRRGLRRAWRRGSAPPRSARRRSRAVDIRPVKKSSAATRRFPLPDDNSISPLSATNASGISALGSASAAEPQTVPRARVCACPTQGSASASSGWRFASSGHASSAACRSAAPTRIALSFIDDAAQLGDVHDVDQHLRPRHPHRKQRHQRLPAGDDRCVPAFGGQRLVRFRE